MVAAAKLRICVGTLVIAYAVVGRAQTIDNEDRPASQSQPPGYQRYHRVHAHDRIFRDSIVRFEPDSPGLQLWAYTGVVPVERFVWGYHYGGWYHRGYAPIYAPVCDGPCAIPMPPGHYQLALSKDGGSLVRVDASILIRGPSEIRGSYIDRSGTRTAGAVVGIGGTLAGIVMLAAAESSDNVCDSYGYCYRKATIDGTLAAGGVGVMLGSIIVGAVLLSQRDEAIITVRPLTLGSAGSGRPLISVVPVMTRPPQGGSLSISF
jgi:hypothetical protein